MGGWELRKVRSRKNFGSDASSPYLGAAGEISYTIYKNNKKCLECFKRSNLASKILLMTRGSGPVSGYENFPGRVPSFEIFCPVSGPGSGFHFKIPAKLAL